jgi:hypothetical protein
MPESLGRRGGAWRRRTAPPLIVQGQGGKWAFASGCLQRRCVSPLLRDTSRHGTRATATATSTRRRSYPFSAAAWPLAARPDRLRPPGFRLSTALLDSDNGPSFYATRMTHRFGGGDAMLPDSDGRCFLAAAGDELRMTYRFSGFTRISHYSAAGLNLRDWLRLLSSSFQCAYRRG